MNSEQQQYQVPEGGLTALGEVRLIPALDNVLQNAESECGGSASWRHRKLHEARELLALSMMAQRFNVVQLDLRESLRALCFLKVPVPLQPDENGHLRTAPYAMLGLTYRECAVLEPQPGYSYCQVLEPKGIYHPNVSDHLSGGQAVCLGGAIPAATRLKEILLMVYGALSMQSVMVDEESVEGVMNRTAARWWQVPENLALAPLTRQAFLDGDEDGYLAKCREEKVPGDE